MIAGCEALEALEAQTTIRSESLSGSIFSVDMFEGR